MTKHLFFGLILGTSLYSASNQAAEAKPMQKAAAPRAAEPLKIQTSDSDEAGTLPEKIEVQSMKKRYWTVGNEDLMDVVQNRLYVKKGRIELAARYGFYSDDPFMNQKSVGGSVGYHISELVSLHAFYSSISSNGSEAYKQAQKQSFTPVVNPAKSLMGLETRFSLLYGKLSVLGKKIIYYDFNVTGGVARLKTENNDTPLAYFVGLGQQIYLTRELFLTIDYKLMRHSEKYTATTNRSLTTNWIQLGVGLFLF